MDLIFFVGLMIFGFFVGIIASILGIGGGVIMVPFFTLILELEMLQATSTSLFVIIFTSTSATVAFLRQKRIHFQLALYYAPSAIIGSLIGASVKIYLPVDLFIVIFSVFLAYVGFKMLLRPKEKTKPSIEEIEEAMNRSFRPYLIQAIMWGFIGGMASGLLGIGGGTIIVPALALIFGLPIHIAVATSQLIIVFASVSGSVVNIINGTVVWDVAISLALGIVVGTQFGAKLVTRISAKTLQQGFGIFLEIIVLRMLFKAFNLSADISNFITLVLIGVLVIGIILYSVFLSTPYPVIDSTLSEEVHCDQENKA